MTRGRAAEAGACNVPNRTLFVCDNLPVLRGIDSGTVDLIATDPPFNSCRTYAAPMGSRSAGQQYKDAWRWDEVTHEWYDLLGTKHDAIRELVEVAAVNEGGKVSPDGISISGGRNSTAAFVTWLAPRLIEIHLVLKPNGTIYLH